MAAYVVGKLVPGVERWAFEAAMLIGLVPIAQRAVMAALAGMPFTIEMLMTIAAVGAVIIGAAEEGAAVVFLFLVGELLEGVAAGKARASIQALTKLVPKTALLEADGRTREVPAETLAVGADGAGASGRPHAGRRRDPLGRERHRRGAGDRRERARAQGPGRRGLRRHGERRRRRCASASPPPPPTTPSPAS